MLKQDPYVDNNYEYTNQYFSAIPSGNSKIVDDFSFSDVKRNKLISFQKQEVNSITLQEWLDKYHLPEELQTFFINMDIAMKYIHEQGYYIESFALDSIEILNDSIKQIRFDSLQEFPSDFIKQKELVKNNIFLSAVLQIGVYANCLQYFRPETMQFLKENFDQFSIFLPEEDVPYYKGVIERGASVYLSSYEGERKKRDLVNLDKQVSEDSASSNGKKLIKSNMSSYNAEDLIPSNEKENEFIYASLSKKDAAFIKILIYPILILLLGITVLILSFLLK